MLFRNFMVGLLSLAVGAEIIRAKVKTKRRSALMVCCNIITLTFRGIVIEPLTISAPDHLRNAGGGEVAYFIRGGF
ncbi:hypothetical protein, partial [Acidaminococcus intestini]|uniref:hypothetical protein n=1 Tax=Acidaminococcus intestini TaxID=187327 RepID=UPI0027B8F323